MTKGTPVTTRDPNHPGDEPTPGGDHAPSDEQTLAERVMQGDGLQPDAPDPDAPAADGPQADAPAADGPPADGAQSDRPEAPGGDGSGEPAEADTATNVLPAVDGEEGRGHAEDPAGGQTTDSTAAPRTDREPDPWAERTAEVPADESATEQTRVIAPDESTTEETRVIPPQDSAEERGAEERGAERTAVLPAQEDAADDEMRRHTRTDHAEDDAPRSRPTADRDQGTTVDRDQSAAVDRERSSTAAGAAAAGGAGGAAAGAVATDEEQEAKPTKPAKPPRTTDRPLGAFALLVLRIVTAGIFGVHGVQKLLDLPGTREFFGSFPLPQAELFGVITAVGEVAIALGLLLGLAVRIAGLGVMAVAVGALVLVHWTEWPFAGEPGFSGELELLLAAVGFVFLLLGGGRIGLDRMFRRSP